jgi:hypothetical protein
MLRTEKATRHKHGGGGGGGGLRGYVQVYTSLSTSPGQLLLFLGLLDRFVKRG